MPAKIIKEILQDKKISQVELANKINITKQNLSNKMTRNNFSALELVEIADALGLKLMLIPKKKTITEGYVIDYPAELKGLPKRSKRAE